MIEFLSDLKNVLGPRTLWEVIVRMRRNDLLGLAAQLAYFFLLSFFPFLISLVSLTGLVIGDPESVLKSLFETTSSGFLPEEARVLVVDYIDRTLRAANSRALIFGILGAVWLGQASSISVTKAANRSYGLEETRPFWKLRSACLIITLGFTLLIAALTLAVFNVGVYAAGATGLPGYALLIWDFVRWGLAFVTVTLALDLLYYLAPDAKVPFKWITPGGVLATALLFVSGAILSYYVSNIGNYDQVYGQLGAVIIFMLWLYLSGLMVLIGLETNAVIARSTEEKKGVEIVHDKDSSGEH